MYEKATGENKNMEELRSIVAEINTSRQDNYNSSHVTLSTESSTHSSSANPPSDYENNGKSSNPSQSSQQRSRASSSASKRTTPASSLNTSDDYVVTAALPINASNVLSNNNNRVKMNAADLRSPQSQKKSSFRDTLNENVPARSRISTTPHYYQSINETKRPVLYDDVARPSVRDDYVVYDDVPENLTDRGDSLFLLNKQQSLNFQGQITSSLADDETTDDEDGRTPGRKSMSSRKAKRKPLNAEQVSPKQTVARRTLTAPIPSSGYQSQNHSSYSSSSSSSSPIDNTHSAIRDHLISAAAHPLAVAQTSIKFSNNSNQNYPSATTTSYSSTSSHNNDEEFVDLLSGTPQRRSSSSGDFYNRYVGSNGTTHSNTSETSNGFESYTRSPQ